MIAIEERLDKVEQRIGSIPTRTEMEAMLAAHAEQNYQLKSAMDTSYRAETQRLGGIVDNLKGAIDSFTQQLQARNDQVRAIQTDMNDVENRAGRIETAVAEHGQKIARIETELQAMRTTIHGNADSPNSPSIFGMLAGTQKSILSMDQRSQQQHSELMLVIRENQQRIQALEAASVEREKFWSRVNRVWGYLTGTWTGRLVLGALVFTVVVMVLAMALNLSEALETMRLFAEVNGQ